MKTNFLFLLNGGGRNIILFLTMMMTYGIIMAQSNLLVTTYQNVNNLCYTVTYKEKIKVSKEVNLNTLTSQDKLKFTEKSYEQLHHQYMDDFWYPIHDIKYKAWTNVFPEWYTVADLIRIDQNSVTSFYQSNSKYLPGGWVGHNLSTTEDGYYGIDTRLGTNARYYKEDHKPAKLDQYNSSMTAIQNNGYLSFFIYGVPTSEMLLAMTQQGLTVEQSPNYVKVTHPNIKITWLINEKTIIKEYFVESIKTKTTTTKYTFNQKFLQYLKHSETTISPLVFENGDCYENVVNIFYTNFSDACTNETNLRINKPAENISEIKVLPNPVLNDVTIVFPQNVNDGVVKIHSFSGMLIHSDILISKSKQYNYDVSGFPSGMYIVTIQMGSKILKTKFVKL